VRCDSVMQRRDPAGEAREMVVFVRLIGYFSFWIMNE